MVRVRFQGDGWRQGGEQTNDGGDDDEEIENTTEKRRRNAVQTRHEWDWRAREELGRVPHHRTFLVDGYSSGRCQPAPSISIDSDI